MAAGTTLIIGGTRGLGLDLARRLTRRGENVMLTGRDADVAASVAAEISPTASAAAVDLTRPAEIASALESIERVDHIVLMAIDRDANSVRDYRIEQALQLATLKLVGYTEVLHCLHPRMHEDTSVLLFGGQAKDRPYPGSTTVTSVNGAVVSMVRTLAIELAPVRVNALHPGIVGDSPAWASNAQMLDAVMARTPTRRLVTMEDISEAAVFLLKNRSVNGVNLTVDSGWMLM